MNKKLARNSEKLIKIRKKSVKNPKIYLKKKTEKLNC